jgi:polyisoprenoid-binding protein YceI
VRGQLRVSFAATSTLHDFEGEAPAVAVALAQTGAAWSADVAIPVASLDTGNRWRDGDMREMFDAGHFPEIRGRVRGVDPETARSRGELEFTLRIRDVERTLRGRIANWRRSERQASFDVEFDVSLAAFGLEAPSTFFSRVGDVVHVRVRVELERT